MKYLRMMAATIPIALVLALVPNTVAGASGGNGGPLADPPLSVGYCSPSQADARIAPIGPNGETPFAAYLHYLHAGGTPCDTGPRPNLSEDIGIFTFTLYFSHADLGSSCSGFTWPGTSGWPGPSVASSRSC